MPSQWRNVISSWCVVDAFLCGSEHCWKLELGGREWWDEGGRGELIVTSSKLSLHSGGAFVEPLPSHDRLADQNSSKKQKCRIKTSCCKWISDFQVHSSKVIFKEYRWNIFNIKAWVQHKRGENPVFQGFFGWYCSVHLRVRCRRCTGVEISVAQCELEFKEQARDWGIQEGWLGRNLLGWKVRTQRCASAGTGTPPDILHTRHVGQSHALPVQIQIYMQNEILHSRQDCWADTHCNGILHGFASHCTSIQCTM